MSMRLVVLESPYAGEVERNVEYARRAVKDCLDRGEAPIASHLLFTQPGILNDAVIEERQLGIEAGLAWLAKAHAMVIYLDYGMSKGMEHAAQRASGFDIPILYRSIGQNPVDGESK